MKRLLLVLFLIMSLTACSQAEQPEKPQEKPQITPLIKKTHYDEEGNMWTWEDNICWTRKGDTVRVAGSGTLEKVHMRTVKSFWDDEVTKVIIEDGITGIGKKCFYEWYNLEEIELPDSITFIGNKAFERCYRLKRVELPNTVTTIGNRAFSYCWVLKEIAIPDNVKQIGKYSFYECESLEKVYIGKQVVSIGNCAFAWCRNMRSIELNEGVVYIGKRAFGSCYRLENIELPESVRQIETRAFSGCYSLKSLTLPRNLEIYKKSAVKYCRSLSQITNESSKDWNFPRKDLMEGVWQCEGKDVKNRIPREQTIAVEPEVYDLTYNVNKEQIKANFPTVYIHTEGVKLPTLPKRDGYEFAGWGYEDEEVGFELLKENYIRAGKRGTKSLDSCFVQFRLENMGKNRIRAVCRLEDKWLSRGFHCIVRCSKNKDMSDSEYISNWEDTGNVVFKKLEKGKRYYIEYAVFKGLDWEEIEDMSYEFDHDWQGKRSIVVE